MLVQAGRQHNSVPSLATRAAMQQLQHRHLPCPPGHRHEVWCEADAHVLAGCLSQPLLNLGHVPVPRDAVGIDALCNLGVQVGLLGAASRAADTCSAHTCMSLFSHVASYMHPATRSCCWRCWVVTSVHQVMPCGGQTSSNSTRLHPRFDSRYSSHTCWLTLRLMPPSASYAYPPDFASMMMSSVLMSPCCSSGTSGSCTDVG